MKKIIVRAQRKLVNKIMIINLLIIIAIIYFSRTIGVYGTVALFCIWFVILFFFRTPKWIILFDLFFLMIFVLFWWSWTNTLKMNNQIFAVNEVKKGYVILSSGCKKYYLSSYNQSYNVGEYLKISGNITKINFNHNPWEFDFTKYLNDKNIIYKISENAKIISLDKHNYRYDFYQWLNKRTEFEKDMFGRMKEGDSYSDLVAMSLSNLYNISYFCIFLVNILLSKMFKTKLQNIIEIILIQFLVPLLIFENIPEIVLKTYLFTMINSFFNLTKFRIRSENKFCLVWMIELTFNPWYVFNIGFVYVSLCFLFLKKVDENKKIIWFLKNFLLINLIFIPIQQFYDYKIFWTSNLYQILIAPIMSTAFLLSIPSLFCPIGNYQVFINSTVIKTTNFFNAISYATIVGHISILVIVIYFVFLKLYLIFHREVHKYLFLGIGVFIYAFSLSITPYLIPDSVTMLNVANGNSFFFHANNCNYLIDAGAGYGKSKTIVRDFLVYYGIRNLERVYITHNHDDHNNQLSEIKKVIKIHNINTNTSNFMPYVEDHGVYFYSFEQLGHEDENANSQVIVVKIGARTLLFTGDANNEVLNSLTANTSFCTLIDRGVDFYQVPHHGSNTSDSLSFLQLIQPKIAFISCEYQKSRPFPKYSVIHNLDLVGVKNPYITGGLHSYCYFIKNNNVIEL